MNSGSGQSSTIYTAAILAALCEGPIIGIGKVWTDKSRTTMHLLNLGEIDGALAQAPWGLLTVRYPGQALNYPGTAMVYSPSFLLGDNAELPNLSFEVYGQGIVKTIVQAGGMPITVSLIDLQYWAVATGTLGSGAFTSASAGGHQQLGMVPKPALTPLPITSATFTFTGVAQLDVTITTTVVITFGGPILIATTFTISSGDSIPLTSDIYSITFHAHPASGTSFSITAWTAVVGVTQEIDNFASAFGTLDVSPKDVITDFLQNAIYGAAPGFPLADLTGFHNYCLAAGLLLSPAFTEQQAAAQHLADLIQCCNSEFVWSQGQLNIIPYGDASLTGNGVTWTPNLTPIYDLGWDDFIPQSTGDDPIKASRVTSADAYNHIQVEFLNRYNDYNIEIAEAKDQADIETVVNGVAKGVRTQSPVTLHQICDPQIARSVAQHLLQRVCYIRNTYKFSLGWKYCQLEPMDLVTITDSLMGLNKLPVLIKAIEEDEEGNLAVEAEEYPYGVNSWALYPHTSPAGYVSNLNAPPGGINPPIFFEPPSSLLQGDLELWVAISGGEIWGGCDVYVSPDGVSYQYATSVLRATRQGTLLADLPVDSDPDTTNTLSVDVSQSVAQLLAGTQTDADTFNTLCYVGGELISYRDAVLTANYQYALSYLRRGAYGSVIADHPANSPFVRLDSSIVKIPFLQDRIGTQLYIKCVSHNSLGGGVENIADVPAYSYTLTGVALSTPPADVTGFNDFYQGSITILTWNLVADLRPIVYEIRFGAEFKSAMVLGTAVSNQFQAVGNGTYWIIARSPMAQSINPASLVIAGAVIVKNIVVTYDEAATSWGGTLTGAAVNDGTGRIWLTTDGGGNVLTPGAYEIPSGHIYDLGSVQTCQLSCNYTATSDAPADLIDSWADVDSRANWDGNYAGYSNVQIQVASSQDGTTWGAWQNFIPGPYTGRMFKFKAVLTSINTTITAALSAFSFTIDMPDKFESFTNQVIASGGTALTFATPFQIAPNVQVTILNAVAGDKIAFLAGPMTTGLTLQITNGGTGVARNCNILAQAY